MSDASQATLKLYIDSTSVALVHQVADLVRCAEDPGVHKLATWLRLPIDAALMASMQARQVPQAAAVDARFLQAVDEAVKRVRPGRIEIHANQTHAWRGVVPVLGWLRRQHGTRDVDIQLELYDDGNLSLLQREQMKQWPDLDQRVTPAAAELAAAIDGWQPTRADLAQSYAYHRLFPTRYHVIRRDLLLRDAPGRRLHAWLDPLVQDMRFDALPGLSDAQSALYLALFGIDADVVDAIAPLAGRADAFLYVGTGCWEERRNAALARSQAQALAQLHAAGLFPPGLALGYKGHPVNGRCDAVVMRALGEPVLRYPSKVPIEVLALAGLLPQRIGGMLSTSFCSLPEDRVAFVLCHEGASGSASETSAPLQRLVRETGLIAEDRLLPIVH